MMYGWGIKIQNIDEGYSFATDLSRRSFNVGGFHKFTQIFLTQVYQLKGDYVIFEYLPFRQDLYHYDFLEK